MLALGVARALAARPESFAELSVLLVTDEEWRSAEFAHVQRLAGYDACLCFEAGERTASGDEGVVVRRKAAGTLRVTATGRASHSGSAPDKGRNALLALARTALRGRRAPRPRWSRATERRADGAALRRRVQRGPGGGRADLRPARHRARRVRAGDGIGRAGARRREARGEHGTPAGRGWTRAQSPRRCWSAPAPGSGARSSAFPAAVPATPATLPARSR